MKELEYQLRVKELEAHDKNLANEAAMEDMARGTVELELHKKLLEAQDR